MSLLDLLQTKGMADILNAKINKHSKRRIKEIESSQEGGRHLPSEEKHRQDEQRKLYDTIGERPTFIAAIIRIIFIVGIMLVALRIITGEPIFFSDE